ncbi:MAG: 50S ribosomal protein L31e [Thermoplasmata archaeon]|nr:50S ribosomal protein L31e [Thermoplasmata archaeon]MCI4344505.1 50S ribosomal protein L31e [Thermoplasmata archaeon]
MARETKKSRTEELEREYTIPLRPSQHQPSRRRRAGHALETVRRFVMRHMKGARADVWIDPRLNEYIWERGIQHLPRQVRVKAIRFEDGLIEVDLLEHGASA